MIRLSWSQPEDLITHELVASRDEGKDVDAVARAWADAGGSLDAPPSGSTPVPAPDSLRALARELLDELDRIPVPDQLAAAEPDDLTGIEALWPTPTTVDAVAFPRGTEKLDALDDRVHGAWLGRAAGCLLGKPVEKISRAGIREIAESTGTWPLDGYFTAVGLDPSVAERFPWNRKSRATSLRENIVGMPEDDDMNFPLIAVQLLERSGPDFTLDDVASSWLENLPGARVFTAERIVYRNLLDGIEPERAGSVRNPFREWIGAQIRTDVYGWVRPGDPRAAARLAYRDARLSHSRSGLYGALFVAAACSASVVADDIETVLDAGVSVVPPKSRFAAAIAFGRELGSSALDGEAAIDAIVERYGTLHWVHALNNSCLAAFALTRSRGDFAASITTAVSGGWDTDSTGATVGSITGALAGAAALPDAWIAPLRNRLSTSIPGMNAIGFDELTRRTVALMPGATS